ncbi:hypothetical protein NKH77_04080 [Streptomyces sp. M19]
MVGGGVVGSGLVGVDGYQDRLMKMLPADVVSLYLVGSGVVPGGHRVALAVWSGVCCCAVIVVRVLGTGTPRATCRLTGSTWASPPWRS